MSLKGEPAPDFSLENTAGNEVQLSESHASGPAVLVFFRGTWCSFCQEQLNTFDFLEYDLKRNLGVDILPVTNDTIPDLIEMRDRFNYGIQLLSDPNLDVTEMYTGTEENRRHGRIPIPNTVIVDPDGIVRYDHAADRPDDRTYANYVRGFIDAEFGGGGYTDVYPGRYPDPYIK